MKKPRKLVTRFCAVVFALQFGCATSHPSPEPAERGDMTQLGTVALVTVQFEPATYHVEVGSTPSTRTTDFPLNKFAKVLAMQLVLNLPGAWMVALAKNAIDKSKGIPEPTNEKPVPTQFREPTNVEKPMQTQIYHQLEPLMSQKALREEVVHYAAKNALPPFAVLEGQGLSALDEPPAYYSPPDQSVDTVLEVGITEFFAVKSKSSESSSQFVLTGRGRLIRIRESTELIRNTTILDRFTYTFYTNSYTLDEWLADDGKLVASELARGYRDLAEAFVNKWLINYQEEKETWETGSELNFSAMPIYPVSQRDGKPRSK